MITPDVYIGKGTKIYQPELVNLYGCQIGNNCRIAAFVEIQRDVIIGHNVKIEAFSFIPTGVIVKDGAFIGPHVCFTNDKYPRATNENGDILQAQEWVTIQTLVEERASIGANSTIICGVTIGRNSMVGAHSIVTKDVASDTLVVGQPARLIRKLIT